MSNAHDHPHPSIFAKRPVLTGIAVGVASLAPHAFLTPQASLGFAAVLIALIAGIYFGFAVMNGSGRDQLVEFSVTGLFAVTGLLGLLFWPILLPLAYSPTRSGTWRTTTAPAWRWSPFRNGTCPGAW